MESLDGKCELCGTDIRYVFLVSIEGWPTMEVGEICCDNLTSSEMASNHLDSVKRYESRRRTFVASKRWKAIKDDVAKLVK